MAQLLRREENDAENRICSTLDDLQRIAEGGRAAVLGQGFFDKARKWYSFDPPAMNRVIYHPLVRVADLQMLNLREANELTTPVPKFFIQRLFGQPIGARDRDREACFRANWDLAEFQMELLYAETYAGIVGSTPLQVFFDPDFQRGLGAVRLRARDPESYYPDPSAYDDEERSYIILEDNLSIEEIARLYGRESADLIQKEFRVGSRVRIPRTQSDYPATGLALPPGPLQSMGPLGHGAFSTPSNREGRLRVRTLFIKDSTRMPFTDQLRLTLLRNEDLILPEPADVPMFPNGRVIVECQRRILHDGPNPYRGFPVFRLCALPPLYGYWAPPLIRYTQDLQSLAEEMFSQTFENAYRMNNAMMFIKQQSGLTSNDVDGLPGRLYFVDPQAGENAAQIVVTPPFPQHFLDYPKYLLEMQREQLGMTAARSGNAGAGNVGMGLFDSEVFQAQAITRLRSRLLASTMKKIAAFVFETMTDTIGSRIYPMMEGTGADPEAVLWEGGPQLAQMEWNVLLDGNSLRLDSAASLRQLALTLARFGKIDDETLYEWLEAPDQQGIMERRRTQALWTAIQAVGQLQPARGGHKAG